MTPSNDQLWIAAKFPGKCAECECEVLQGDRVLYVPTERRVYCEECGNEMAAQPVKKSVPVAYVRDQPRPLLKRTAPNAELPAWQPIKRKKTAPVQQELFAKPTQEMNRTPGIPDHYHKCEELLTAGYHLLQNALAHPTHGGPTKADAEAWLRKVEQVLGKEKL
jgi:hypothetical protein